MVIVLIVAMALGKLPSNMIGPIAVACDIRKSLPFYWNKDPNR